MYQAGGTIEDAVVAISKNEFVLPAIQREFVWRPDQIERLFDSLMQGYPFGTFLFWKVEPANAATFKFYDFVRNYHEKNGAHCPELGDMKGRQVTAVLDGQQRLTALNIGLRGSMAWRLKGKRRNNLHAYPKRKLYLDLLGVAAEDDTGIVYRFKFLDEDAAKAGDSTFWFPVSRILDLEDGSAIYEVIEERDLAKEERKRAYNALDRLRTVIRVEPLISYYEEKSQHLDRVLNIFIRLNSGGTVLSYSDLLLSIAVAQWTNVDARSEIHGLVDDINEIGAGFAFNHDFVLKAGLMLADTASVGFKVDNFTAKNMAILENRWKDIRRAIILAVELTASFGLSSSNLRAESAILPVAYYIFMKSPPNSYLTAAKWGGDREAIRFWLIRSLLKPSGIWGSGLDTLLTSLREVIQKHGEDGFPADQLARRMAQRGKALNFDEEEVEELLEMRYADKRTFLLLSLMFPFVDLRNQFHVDHVYPISRFSPSKLKAAGYKKEEGEDLRWLADTIPNLQLLDGAMNNEKRAKLPAEWLRLACKSRISQEDYCAKHRLGTLPECVEDFEDFAEKRTASLREVLVGLLMARSRGIMRAAE
ncbi:uncharacterized protein with ParB-like and HNH nuclease domain [Limimaricola soesokkakensis]|uniref:Uncharacterized protein with ParB-like and HNH nuclease domain n=1 Tax=Limimaricola soesokkakensis TaxID=1343159 RepID=A0A1X6Z969_9RHOB|nr:DUF262 domain-containing protein [Limimaricola soesokkakensis]PSK86575.1 uncharacterized protein with ParB-like and HNH nuclease domain [Limimaricola soesokkakensis]SLN44007.1 hypothetical protein LOS8367_01947 [Limimaricola soesokkakensis]